MTTFDHSHVSRDFNYYFGRQWRFSHISAAEADPRKLEYRHIRSYSHAFDDPSIERTDLYETQDGKKVLRLWLSVPTFDADDRVCDSWRSLYLYPSADGSWAGTDGIYAAGGYQLAFAAAVHTLLAYPRELEELPLMPSLCTHKPGETFEYHEESSGITWQCQIDKDLPFITILGLEAGKIREGSLKIPDIVDDLPVEKIHPHAFDKENRLEEILLPRRLYRDGLEGPVFDNCRALKNIRVSPQSRFYCSEDGVLYSARDNRKTLVRYPAGRQDRSYRVAEGTVSIQGRGFARCEALEEILIPDSVISIGFYAFDHCASLTTFRLPDQLSLSSFKYMFNRCDALKNIIVSEDSQNFSSRDGVLWDKQGTTILWSPPASQIETAD